MHSRLLTHFTDNHIISDKQAAYLKGDSTTNQLIYLVHTIRQAWSQGKVTQGVFLDVMGAFDKVWHSGLLAKLTSVGVTDKCLELFKSYLTDRKQVVVVDGVKSNITDLTAGVPQGSRLGPLLFILYIDDLQNDLDSDCLLFADDTTLLATGDTVSDTTSTLNSDLCKITDWSKKWKVTFNPSKSETVVFTSKPLPPSSPDLRSPHTNWFPPLTFNNTTPLLFHNSTVKRVTTHKHLGVHLSATLDWSDHVHHICLKANRKLSVLRGVKHLKRSTLDVLYKLTVRSVIDFSLPVFFGNLKQTDILKLEQLQYRAAKLVTGALHYSSREKLNSELGWESLQDRYHILGLSLFRKIINFDVRPLILTLKPGFSSPSVNTRQGPQYKQFPFSSVKMSKSFFPYFTKLWNTLDKTIKCESDINEFKTKLKQQYKPTRHRHFDKGSQTGNKLLTRLRLNRSFLKDNSFTIGLTDDPSCACGHRRESTSHYLLDCSLYTSERQTLFDQISLLISQFKTFSKTRQLNILLRGFNTDNNDYRTINK